MTVIQFLNYMNYGCGLPPDSIDKGRWKGMIRWYHGMTTQEFAGRYQENLRDVETHLSAMQDWFRRGCPTDETDEQFLDSEAIGDTSESVLNDFDPEPLPTEVPDDEHSLLDIPDDNYNDLENY